MKAHDWYAVGAVALVICALWYAKKKADAQSASSPDPTINSPFGAWPTVNGASV